MSFCDELIYISVHNGLLCPVLDPKDLLHSNAAKQYLNVVVNVVIDSPKSAYTMVSLNSDVASTFPQGSATLECPQAI